MKHLLKYAAIGAMIAGSLTGSAAAHPDDKSKPVPAMTGPIDIETSEGALMASRKVGCSLEDGKPVTFYWFGKAYSRRMGERDKHMFNVEGMNVRQCSTVTDPKRGTGYRLVSRELLFYKDPETNKVLKMWDNPWTGEEVEVMHVANDPVNFTAYEKDREGKMSGFSGHIMGDRWHMTNTVPLFYPNPLAGEFQSEIGGIYHATEMFNFMGQTDSLLDPEQDTANLAVGWARMSDWLPWMKMAGRDGVIYMHTAGRKLGDWDEMPEAMKKEIRRYYPDYTAPPPLDDDRKNVTSWEYYKRVTEGDETLPKR